MVEYLIGFRNGTEIRIRVHDGELLVKQMLSAKELNIGDGQPWYCEKLLIINVSEIVFVMPRLSDA